MIEGKYIIKIIKALERIADALEYANKTPYEKRNQDDRDSNI